MGNTYDLRFSRKCYYVCLGICAVLGSAYLVLSVLDISLKELYPYPCFLYALYGLYCPGCGGTRSVIYLFQGDFIKSFMFHPAVPYTAVLVACYIISHTLNIITRGKIKAMLFRPIYFYVMIAVILLQWIVKNIIILTTGTYLPGQ
ncbi:MAG: DUF2752 domain-containing protein [Lachnospiraceae bacterium]|nr:DUF2752 domain-containing protein [Lachnospiraceae bacterium]